MKQMARLNLGIVQLSLAFLCLDKPAFAGGNFFGSDYNFNLYAFSSGTKDVKRVMQTTYLSNPLALESLAMDSYGRLYGIDSDTQNNLYLVNQKTGELQLAYSKLSGDDSHIFKGMAFLADGRVAGALCENRPYSPCSVVAVNIRTRSVETLVPLDLKYGMKRGGLTLALGSNQLYWIVGNHSNSLCRNHVGEGTQTLLKIDLNNSNAVKVVGCLDKSRIRGLGMLYSGFSTGNIHSDLYGADEFGNLVQIDPETAKTNTVTNHAPIDGFTGFSGDQWWK